MKNEIKFKKVSSELNSCSLLSQVEKQIISLIQSYESNNQPFYSTNSYIANQCSVTNRSVISNINKLRDIGLINIKNVALIDINDDKVLYTWQNSWSKQARFISINKETYNKLIKGNIVRETKISQSTNKYKAKIAELEARIAELEANKDNNIIQTSKVEVFEEYTPSLMVQMLQDKFFDVKEEEVVEIVKEEELNNNNEIKTEIDMETKNEDYGKESVMNMSTNRIKLDKLFDEIIATAAFEKQLITLFQYSSKFERGFDKFIDENRNLIIKFCKDNERDIPSYVSDNLKVKAKIELTKDAFEKYISDEMVNKYNEELPF